MSKIAQERESGIEIYPPHELVFNALNLTPFTAVKVVIIGQDPYHNPGQAHGLSFSVPKKVAIPPSLRNIFIELHTDLGVTPPNHGCLESWARQGVLLLNSTLTVQRNTPLSHHGIGWELFTDAIVKELFKKKGPPIFVLFGKNAQKKILHAKTFAHHNDIVCLSASHPSPFAAYRGFFGSKPFSKINDHLIEKGERPISWEKV